MIESIELVKNKDYNWNYYMNFKNKDKNSLEVFIQFIDKTIAKFDEKTLKNFSFGNPEKRRRIIEDQKYSRVSRTGEIIEWIPLD